jgi:2-aminoadipate transaminase
MPSSSLHLSQRALRTEEQPISYFMQQAVENPNLISLAAGLVDAASLPAAEVHDALNEILTEPASARAALQYGTTQGYGPLREKVLAHALRLDGLTPGDVSMTPDDVVITTGSQQLLYLLGEVLFDPGDIVITEAPSYFVYHGILTSIGVRTLTVPMDEHGMQTDALEELLQRLHQTGELDRVRLIYTVDYFQNPSGLTLSLERRRHLLDLAKRYSKRHRLLVLEDAAYRELRFDGADVPSLKSFDRDNTHVIQTMTFSKPMAPGLKTGYGLLPRGVMEPLLHFKGNHDFGSSNLCQHLLDRVLTNGSYDRHVRVLRDAYRHKRDVVLEALRHEFPATSGVRWTEPDGGFYVWLTMPETVETGPSSPMMQACLKEGVLYVPGEFCYVKDGAAPRFEARLCYGVATPEQLREAVRRLGRAARAAGLPRITQRRLAGCRA